MELLAIEGIVAVGEALFEAYQVYKVGKTAYKAAKSVVQTANKGVDWAKTAKKLRELEATLDGLRTFKPASVGHPECALAAL